MIFLEYVLIGLLGSVGIILISKVVMASILQRPEDFYRDKYDLPESRGGGDSDV